MENNIFTKIGGRKFVIALVAVAAGLVVELAGKGLSPTLAGFLVAVVGAFSVTNMSVSKKGLEQSASPAPSSTELQPDLTPQLVELQSTVQALQSQVDTSQETLGAIGQAVGNTQKLLQAIIQNPK
jgi:hypothetical protein